MIRVLESGTVYRNPRPELRSRHTWHPTIVRFDDGEMVATFDIAEADASMDYRTYVVRSVDGGSTWTAPVRLIPDPPGRATTHSVRTSRVSGDCLVAMGGLVYRDDPNEALVNVENLGFAEMEVILTRSDDRGRTWQPIERVDPPLEGPAFEVCHSVVELRDGRWVWPTSTWKGWDGAAPNGMNAILLISSDQGRSWPSSISVIDRWGEGILHWEQHFLELRDGRWLSTAWAVDLASGQTLASPYAISRDGGGVFVHGLTGFLAQTTKTVELPDGRILAIYRRHDEPGLWASVASLDDDIWTNLDTTMLWTGQPSGMAGIHRTGAELTQLKFGFPQMVVEPDGHVFVVFWCEEDCIKSIRWVRLFV